VPQSAPPGPDPIRGIDARARSNLMIGEFGWSDNDVDRRHVSGAATDNLEGLQSVAPRRTSTRRNQLISWFQLAIVWSTILRSRSGWRTTPCSVPLADASRQPAGAIPVWSTDFASLSQRTQAVLSGAASIAYCPQTRSTRLWFANTQISASQVATRSQD